MRFLPSLRICLPIALLLVSIGSSPKAKKQSDDFADLVFFNGKIITVDPNDRIVSAVAVKDSLIYKVGNYQDIQPYVGPNTDVRNLNGRCMTPGMIDAHTHLMYYGQVEKDYVNLRPPDVQTVNDVVAKIAARVKTVQPGEWIIGDGYFKLERMPTKYDLDPISPDNPVFLNSIGGHYGSVNSKAMEIAGIDSSTQDPVGGIIERDSTGHPDGVLWNHPAMDLIRVCYPAFDQDDLTADVIFAQEKYLAAGVTSFQDVNCRALSRVQAYIAAVDSMKIRGYLSFTIENTNDANTSLEKLVPYQGPVLSLISDKMLLDGQPPTSYTSVPHLGPSYDLPTWDPDTLKMVVKKLHAANHQLAFHVMGDLAIDLALDAIEEALQENPRADHRHRLEHVMIPTQEQIQRMKQLDVIVSVQPSAIYTSGDFYIKIWGTEVAQRLKPIRSFLDAGLTVAFGTDYPTVLNIHPKNTLWAALARKTSSGRYIAPEQRITIQEALRAHTMGSAYAAFEEDKKGSIEEGKYADFTIWSDDLYSVPISELPNLYVLGVVVGGVVHENPNVGVANSSSLLPDDFVILHNYPNPFNSSTNIVYYLTKPGDTRLQIFNNQGRLIKTIINTYQLSGEYVRVWNGTNEKGETVSSGQYYIKLSQNNHTITDKILLLK